MKKESEDAIFGCGCASVMLLGVLLAKLAFIAAIVGVVVWALRAAGVSL